MIDVIFKDSMDIYLARQVVMQRLLETRDLLPPGADPQLVPNTTGLSEVFQYYLEGPADNNSGHQMSETELMERRTLQDWVIRPMLKTVPDVVDVNAMGGFVKQYQVIVDPEMLRKYDLALHDVFEAVAKNNANAGGNILEKNAEKYIVRGVGLIKSIEDIDLIVVKQVGGTPVYVRDVADVKIGHAVRHGAAVVNGNREAVAGIVLDATRRECQRGCRGGQASDRRDPPEISAAEWAADRALLRPTGVDLRGLNTVYKALLEGIVPVIVVLFLFLGTFAAPWW